MPLNYGLAHRLTSALQGFHIALATQLWHLIKVKGSSPGQHPSHSPSQPSAYTSILHHSTCLPDIQKSFS